MVENLGDRYTNLEVIGTILHPESLLANLLRRPDFEARRYRSIEAFSPRADLWAEWRRRFVDLSNPRRIEAARRYFRVNREAMLAGTRILWPAKETYYDLMVQLATRGRRAFYQEKQNEPLGAGAAVFDAEGVARFRRVEGELVLTASAVAAGGVLLNARAPDPFAANESHAASCLSENQGKKHGRDVQATGGNPSMSSSQAGGPRRVALDSLRIVAFLDPALGRGAGGGGGGAGGRAARGDFAALAIVGAASDQSFYLLEAWVRRAPPLEQIRAVFDAHERWRIERLGVEGNCFQDLLRLPFEQERDRRRAEGRAWNLPLEMITHRRNKIERISALEPLAANGWIAFSEALPEEFWRELQAFPGADHDDALDAMEGAVALARRTAGAGRSLPAQSHGPAERRPPALREF